MCKAFMDMKLEGVLEGKNEERQEHLVRTVCIKLRKNKSAEVIADELEEDLSLTPYFLQTGQFCYIKNYLHPL